MKKVIPVLLAFALVISLLSSKMFVTNVHANDALNAAHITRTEQLIISDTTDSQSNESEGWAWDKNTNTLTLDNVDFSVSNEESTLLLKTSVTIVLIGSNTIENSCSSKSMSVGIESTNGNLVFSGDGSLTVSGGKTELISWGIFVDSHSDMTINSGTITAMGGYASGTYSDASGIRVKGQLKINGGTVFATGGTACNSSVVNIYGIDRVQLFSSAGITSSNSNIVIAGGTLIATGGIGGVEEFAGAAIVGHISLENSAILEEPINGRIETIQSNNGKMPDSVLDSSGKIAKKVVIQDSSSTQVNPNAPSSEPVSGLKLVSSTPVNGARDVVDDTLSVTFNTTINSNLNWSAGTIQIRDYASDRTVLTIDNEEFYKLSGYVSDATLTIPYALSNLTAGKHYYVLVDKDLIWAATANTDGSISRFDGFEDYEFHFVISPAKTPTETETKTLPFRGTIINIGWNWDYFSGDARTKSANMNLALAALALSAEDESPANTIETMKTLGFTSVDNIGKDTYDNYIEPYYYDNSDYNRPALVIGSTRKIIDGKEKTIIALAIRGTKTWKDGLTDIAAADNAFTPSIDSTYDTLTYYIKSHYPDLKKEDTILFITGHSLGGGVAGGLALRTDSLANRGNTFVYTFASPNYRTSGYKSSDYENVINYINGDDIVPMLPIATGPNSKVGRNVKYSIYTLSTEERKRWQQAYSLLTDKTPNQSPFDVYQNHIVETYMAFLLSDVSLSTVSNYFNVVGIHCPVDVKVYNSNGSLMSSVTNGKISYSSDTEVLVYVDGDEKYVIMPTETEYRIELSGTDIGTMQYVVQKICAETGEAKTEKDFSNIPLYFGKQIVNEVGGSTEVAGTRLFVLDEKGNPAQEIIGVVRESNVNRFADVLSNAYYYDAVMWALENNVTTGTSDTTFSPDSTCTRAQVVTFLWRAMNRPAPSSTMNPFEDVKAGQYYTDAVLWAIEKGITIGTSSTTFSPNNTCTNAEILTFIWRCLGEPGLNGSGVHWYFDALNWAISKSLLKDTNAATTIEDNCPRRDVVTFLYRALTGTTDTVY